MTLLRFILLALLLMAQTAMAQPRFDFDTTPGRLPKSVLPERCALTLTLDPESAQFSGQAVITLRVREPVRAIVLHAAALKANRALLGERPLTVSADEPSQTWTLTPTDGAPIAAGQHQLTVDYDGRVRNNGAGLYQSPHSVAGQPARMLATQLQAIDARAVFPSFDEPAFRTVFELTVRAPKGYEVLSNMNETAVLDDGAQRVHRFAPTPPMPSYLVAVAVGRFDAVSGQAAGVPLRVLSAPGKREQGAYALAVLGQLLPYYNGYFGIPYALPKLDMLAVPSNRQGAMEDWGLISFAESQLLFDPENSGAQARRRIFSIVAHEVAHQWFGNLVTAASWDEIWLNEAFATWLAEKATDRFNPDWQLPLRRRMDIEEAMARDAGTATRAIRSGPVPEDQVFDVFDDITYDKGGAVLTMLERWIGPEPFRRGLADYMQARQLSNATAGDLWFHIGKASGRDVAALAASWTDQPGFPLVSVAARCADGQTVVDLRQQRFTTTPATTADANANANATANAAVTSIGTGTGNGHANASPGPASTAVWQIPVVLMHGGALSTVLLDTPTRSLLLPGCPSQPLLANPTGDGFYRVAYAPAQQAALAAAYASLPASAQVGLLSDTLALVQAGRLPAAAYLDLLVALPPVQGPARPSLYAQASSGLGILALALAGTPAQAALPPAARALLAPALATVGWLPGANEDSETEVLRSLLIRQLARYDDPATISQARALFDADQSGRQPLPAAIRAAVLNATGRHADPTRFAQLMLRLKQAPSEDERWQLARAVASTRDPALAQQVLALSLQNDLPNNIAPRLPGLVAEEPAHAAMAYDFVVQHWARLADKTGDSFGQSAGLLPRVAEHMNDRASAQRLVADQQRLAGMAGAALALQAAAQITLRDDTRARESTPLRDLLLALPGRLGARP